MNQITNHSLASYGVGAALGTTFCAGVGLVFGGAFLGHSAAAIGGLCGSGILLILSSMCITALKIDSYHQKQRFFQNGNTNPEAPYIPSSRSMADWDNIKEKNPHLSIASKHTLNGNPNVRANLTIDGLNRLNRGLDDKDL